MSGNLDKAAGIPEISTPSVLISGNQHKAADIPDISTTGMLMSGKQAQGPPASRT
jgi:hypothetical protein